MIRTLSPQSKVKGRSLPRFPLRPDPPAVAPDDAVHRGEADAETRVCLDAGKPPEWDEEVIGVRHGEAGAVVPDETGSLAVDFRLSELDDRLLPDAGILPGVAEEILQNHLQADPGRR